LPAQGTTVRQLSKIFYYLPEVLGEPGKSDTRRTVKPSWAMTWPLVSQWLSDLRFPGS
jgi:hypothetical protein